MRTRKPTTVSLQRAKFFLLILFMGVFGGCNLDPFETLGATEHGVVFSALPPLLGGGLGSKTYKPKQKVLLMPWETLYRLDTGLQNLSWGAKGEGDNKEAEDFVQSRAIDGNEVSLSITVTYRVIPDKLSYVIQRVGINSQSIRRLVTAVARADIRTHMNYLHTEDFATAERQKKVLQVKAAMNQRLNPEGVEVVDVIYEKGLFYRQRADGTLETSYQDQINETEQTNQRTEQERNRSKTVEEEMKQKFATAEGEFYRVKEQADGQLRQAEERGTAKFESLHQDAERVASVGLNEIEGMKKEIEALSGPGGRQLLRKELVKALVEANPKFIVSNSGGDSGKGNAIDVNRLDTNELMHQLGLAQAAQEATKAGAPQEEKK